MGDLFGGSPDVPENKYANELAGISRQRYELSKPLEQAIRDNLLGFMGYEYIPGTTTTTPGTTITPESSISPTSINVPPYMGDQAYPKPYSIWDDVVINRQLPNTSSEQTIQAAQTTTTPGSWKRTGKAFDVASLPWYESGKRSIADAFAGAKDSILSMLPAGGTLVDALTKARIGSAEALGTYGSNLAQDVFNKAFSYATGVPQAAASGLGSAASSYAAGFGPAVAAQGNQNDLLGMLGEGAAWAVDKIPWGSVGAGITSALGGLGSLFSTRRLKRDIVFVGELLLKNNRKIPLIEYNYVWDVGNQKRVGVLAEDVFEILPEATILENGKPLMVNYSVLSKQIKGVA